MMALLSFETFATIYPTTRHNIPGDLNVVSSSFPSVPPWKSRDIVLR